MQAQEQLGATEQVAGDDLPLHQIVAAVQDYHHDFDLQDRQVAIDPRPHERLKKSGKQQEQRNCS